MLSGLLVKRNQVRPFFKTIRNRKDKNADLPDRVILDHLAAGVSIENIRLTSAQSKRQTRLAELRLILQGCVTSNGTLTNLGNRISELPWAVPYALMMDAGLELGVAHEIITIAAIFDTNPLATTVSPSQWIGLVDEEKTSNAMAQLALFEQFEAMSIEERLWVGADESTYQKVREKQRLLITAVKRATGLKTLPRGGGREAIIRCVARGLLLNLYRRLGSRLYSAPTDPYLRGLGPESVIDQPEWVVGIPWNVDSIIDSRPAKLLHVATAVDLRMLCEIAPWLVHTRTDSHCRFDIEQDAVVTRHWVYFLGHMIGHEEKIAPDHPEAERFRAEHRTHLGAEQLLIDLKSMLVRQQKTPFLKKPERREIQRVVTEKADVSTQLELAMWIQWAEKLRTLGQQKIQAVTKPRPAVPPPDLAKPRKLHTHTLHLHRNEAASLMQVVDSEQSQGALNREAVSTNLGDDLFQTLIACGYLVVNESGGVTPNTDYFAHTAFTVNEQDLPKKGRLLKVSGGQLHNLDNNWRSRLRRAIEVAHRRVVAKEAVTQS